MIGWVAYRHFGTSGLFGLVERGFLLPEEFETLYDGQQLLWRIRCSLHYLSGRREDRLLFDYQRDIAHEFGYEDDPDGEHPNQSIEQFMQRYYQTVMELERLNEMLLQHFREAILYGDVNEEPRIIDDAFQVRHGYIEARHKNVFIDQPIKLLELFLCMEQHPEIQGVRAETIRLIRKSRHLINEEFRESEDAKRVFIRIIRQGRGLTHELRRMNRYGILAAYLPAYKAIAGRMQYDLFHAYTVDQHTLFVIRNMRRLAEPEFCHEFPLASGVSHHLKKPELLYIAGLFHDIAKGRGGDHSELGAVDAFEFCSSHGLGYEDSILVSWLVSNHLIMSITAQRKDISDPEVINEFCKLVGDTEHLDYLYLLTLCDIRATNPKQWNSWKDKLLIELYNKTARWLQLGTERQTGRQQEIDHNRTYAMRNLGRQGKALMDVRKIWDNFTDDYFLRHKADEIIWHTMEMMAHPNLDTPLVKVRFDKQKGAMELLVYTRTLDHLFAKIVGVINQLSLNITDAFMMRCRNNCLIETFKIVFTDDILEHIEDYAREIVPQILHRLASSDITDGSNISVPRVQKHFKVDTNVHFEMTDDGQTTRMHIDTADRPGLLSMIARIFIDCDLRIHSAKVSTAGEEAVDYFDLTDKTNNQPLTLEMQERLKKALLEQL
jgi:[protein-PII] uridylyltransferase